MFQNLKDTPPSSHFHPQLSVIPRRFLAEEKVKILRKHLVEKASISDVCNECGIRPTQFYQWQKTLFKGDRPPLTRVATASGSDAATRR
jgi:transposase-like protein